MKILVKAGKMAVVVAVTFVTLTFVANARAQTEQFMGTFVLSNEIQWGTVTLLPGKYSIRITSLKVPGLIWSASTRKEMFIPAAQIAGAEKGGTHLTIAERNGVLRLMSVNITSLGLSLVYVPLTASERSSIVRGRTIETIPLYAEARPAQSLSKAR